LLLEHLPRALLLRRGWEGVIGKRTEISNCAVDLGQLLASSKKRLLSAPPSSSVDVVCIFSIFEGIIHFVVNHGHVHGLIADFLLLEGVLVLRVRDLLLGIWPPSGDIYYGRQEVLL
jgi:hypothetical protein